MSAAHHFEGSATLPRGQSPERSTDTPPAAELIPAPENWPDDPAPEAFHGPAGAFVRAVEPYTEADPVAILAQLLVAFGNLIGRKPHIVIEAATMHLNEFVVLVGRSAKGRKGTSWNRALQALTTADHQWSKTCLRSGLASGEGLIESIRDGNGGEDNGVADKRLMIEEEEFVSVLKQGQRQGNTLSAILRTAWDKGTLRNLTRKAVSATDAHISIVAHITADELKDSLTKTDQANGFANRFLWICTRRRRLLPGGSRNPKALQAHTDKIAQAAAFARETGELQRSAEAETLWHRVYKEISTEEAGLVGVLIGRAEAHITRLSCLYALLDQSEVIEETHLQAALELWKYSERCVRFIFGKKQGTPISDTILTALEKHPAGLNRRQLHSLFNRHRTAEEIERVLQSLILQRLIVAEKTGTRGRPSEVWKLASQGPHDPTPPELAARLREMVEEVADETAERIWQEARKNAPDATAEEVLHAAALYIPRIRSGQIHNPTGFLLTVVPRWFASPALDKYRASQKLPQHSVETPEEDAESLAKRRKSAMEWIPRYEAQLQTEQDQYARQIIQQNLAAARRLLVEHPPEEDL